MTNPAIANDAETPFSTGDADADAFLNLWKPDANQPSERGEKKKKTEAAPNADEDLDDTSEETPEDDVEGDEGEEADEDDADDQDDEGEDDDKGTQKTLAGDDAEVEVLVDGETKKVAVKDLKRLYGQEAALTRKSQEVAETRKKAEEVGTFHVTGLNTMLERAKKAYEPYAAIDFNLAASTLSPEEYTALRDDALAKYEDVKFLETELGGAIEAANKQRLAILQTSAKETLKELTDPEKGIPGFDQKLYDEMRAFAVNQGIPAQVVNELVSAPILRLLHMAMVHTKGKKAATVVKDTKAKKIVKSTSNAKSTRLAVDGSKAAMKKLARTGSQDDAVDAFLAKWK